MPPNGLPVYLDYAATTPLDGRVAEAMAPWMAGAIGNPSSLHSAGRAARVVIEESRKTIAQSLGCQPNELTFTAGGTHGNNLVILGVAQRLAHRGRHLIVSAVEHEAVLNPAKALAQAGWEVTLLPVDSQGVVRSTDLEAALRPDTVLVSVIHGNNEMGAIQPLQAMGTLLRSRGVLLHTDAVQTVGKVPIDLATLPVDYLTFTGHKLYGPKGVGALFIREGVPLPEPLTYGGGQENGLNPGTENVAGIVGLACSVALCAAEMTEETARLRSLQERLWQGLVAGFEGTGCSLELNGPADWTQRVPGNLHCSILCHSGAVLEGEALVLQLDLKGICASSGSACHSAVIEPSRIVKAMGKGDAAAMATLRFSMGRYSTEDDVAQVVAALPAIATKLAHRATKALIAVPMVSSPASTN